MKKVMVTGGAGFLGSHLCEALLAKGNKVYCLDNLLTGATGNIASLMDNPNFTFIQQDIIEPINHLDVDEIYNMACPASPVHYQADPVHTLKTSILGIINLLEYAKQKQIRLLQASTSEIYGDPLVHPQVETYWGNVNPIGLRSCYDEGKRAAETLLFDYHRQYGVDIRVIRIFNTYGPRMSAQDGRVVSNFIVQALQGKDITIYGDGTQTRSFCYVTDLIRGITGMMQTADFIGPVNLGNPIEFTIRELAEKVIRLTGSSSRIVYEALPSDDPTRRKPVIDLALKVMGWQPTVFLDEGLRYTIDYFRNVNSRK